MQGDSHVLQSVTASSTGNLLRMSGVAHNTLEADEHKSEGSEASAVPHRDSGDILSHSHDTEPHLQSSSLSSGMLSPLHLALGCTRPAQCAHVAVHASLATRVYIMSPHSKCVHRLKSDACCLLNVSLSSFPSVHATADGTKQHSSEVPGHAILDGGVTPALPPSNPRPPAYSAAGALRQPDFGVQDAVSTGQAIKGSAAGEQFAENAGFRALKISYLLL